MQLPTSKSETIVMPLSAQEVEKKLYLVTKPPSVADSAYVPSKAIFNGIVKEKTFIISTIITHPDNYNPLISGAIESTSVGCIIFIKYELFFSSRMFLTFWSIISLCLCLFLVFVLKAYAYGSTALIAGILNYTIVALNFRKRVFRCRSLLLETLGD